MTTTVEALSSTKKDKSFSGTKKLVIWDKTASVGILTVYPKGMKPFELMVVTSDPINSRKEFCRCSKMGLLLSCKEDCGGSSPLIGSHHEELGNHFFIGL